MTVRIDFENFETELNRNRKNLISYETDIGTELKLFCQFQTKPKLFSAPKLNRKRSFIFKNSV